MQSVSNNLHRIHQSASVKLAENREKSPVMIDVIRLSRIFDLTRTTIQRYNSMNRIEWEKTTVRHMIELWCRKKHGEKELCVECRELLTYATVRLSRCKFGEKKTKCHKCPVHCYRPDMREKIREVMRLSGPRMIFHHPLEALRYILTR